MKRPMILSLNGWYPQTKEACKKEIEKYIDKSIFLEGRNPIAAVVPHAGWYFSGRLAINSIKILREKNGLIKNIFVFGGHLSPNSMTLCETFEIAETPLGDLTNNQEVLTFLKNEPDIQFVDYIPDNTIEILLPIVKYFFPNVLVTALYLPPSLKSAKLVEKLYSNFGKESLFLGSTDLTHYGPNYGMVRHDKSVPPYEWVKNTNDKNYVDLLLDMEGEKSLDYALKNRSACSAGAALGAITVAKLHNVKKGHLVGYSNSYEIRNDENFVGYTGVVY